MHRLAVLLLLPVAFPVLAGTSEAHAGRYVEIWNPSEARQKPVRTYGVSRHVHPPSAQTDAHGRRRLAETASMPSGNATGTPDRKAANRVPSIPPMIGPDGRPFVV